MHRNTTFVQLRECRAKGKSDGNIKHQNFMEIYIFFFLLTFCFGGCNTSCCRCHLAVHCSAYLPVLSATSPYRRAADGHLTHRHFNVSPLESAVWDYILRAPPSLHPRVELHWKRSWFMKTCRTSERDHSSMRISEFYTYFSVWWWKVWLRRNQAVLRWGLISRLSENTCGGLIQGI